MIFIDIGRTDGRPASNSFRSFPSPRSRNENDRPNQFLAFSMHASKGVYALLLGSGISRAARIPTGWEITLELVRKAAALQGEECEPDPAAWFQSKTGKQPDYSDLLDMIAKTPTERQQLLRSYWEPVIPPEKSTRQK